MRAVLIAAVAFVIGLVMGIALCQATIRYLRRRVKELRAGRECLHIIRSITRFLFVTTQVCAIIWVSWSYGIATYSTIVLAQPFPVEELSRQAIITLLGMSGLKVVENIFEHNESVVFGQSKTEDDPPDGGGEGGVG